MGGQSVGECHGVAGVGAQHRAGQAGCGEGGRLRLVRDDTHQAAGAGAACGGERQAARLAGRAQDGHRGGAAGPGGVLGDGAAGERRSSADVQDGEGQFVGQVGGQDRGDRASEEDGVSAGRHPLPQAVPFAQAVGEFERGQGEGDQGRHPFAGLEAERRLGSGLRDGPDEHAAGAGDGVVHLAALPHDRADRLADGVTVAAVFLVELAVGRRVEVEVLDVDAEFVVAQPRVGVEAQGRLRQHSLRGEHAVQAER